MKQAKYKEGQTWSGTYQGANEDVPTTVTIIDATQKESGFKFDTRTAYTVRINGEEQHLFESELEQELRIIGATVTTQQ